MNPATEPVKIAGYRIEGLLGSGGMSHVYVARQISLDRRVALKVFELGGSGGGQAATRLRREAHLLAKLDHEGIVRCIDFGEADGYFYLALELVDGESLKQRIDRGGKLTGKDAAKIAFAVGHALQHAHAKGVVHRDVKPGNVLLSRDGKVKLGDFGLARTPEDAEITQPGTALGTPQYLSPEQARSPRRAGPQSDVYSLGATLYHMVAGVPPHQGDTLAEVITSILFEVVPPPETRTPDIDAGLSRIVARAMAKDRALRYRNALEFNADLARWLAGQADTTVGISWDEAGSEAKVPRRTGFIAAIAGGSALVLAVASYFVWRPAADSPEPPAVASTLPPASALESGTVTLAAAHAALRAAAANDPLQREFAARLRELTTERVAVLGRFALSAARAEIGAGRPETAAGVFDAELRKRAASAFGVDYATLAPELSDLVEENATRAREELGELSSTVTNALATNLDGALAAALEPADSAVSSDQLAAAEAALATADDGIEAIVRAAYEKGIREVVTEARSIAVPDPWLERALASARDRIQQLRERIEKRSASLEDSARTALAAFVYEAAADPADGEVQRQLLAVIRNALGAAFDQYPTRWPDLATAVTARAAEIEATIAARSAQERAEREAECVARVTEALGRFDVAATRTATEGINRDAVHDPWLAVLLDAADDLERVQAAVLRSFEAAVGRRERVATKGIVKEGVVLAVDSAGHVVRFGQPNFDVPIAEFAFEELERRAGDRVDPRLRAVLAVLAADSAAARTALTGSESAPWFGPVNAAVEELAAARLARERGEVGAAEKLLERFDAALAADDRATAAALADELLKSSAAGRLAEVKARRIELQRVRKDGQAMLELEKRRATIRSATNAAVSFAAGGATQWHYSFDDPKQIADFEVPGTEWVIGGGRLSSLGLLDRRDLGSKIDLYRNRPGLRRALPVVVDASHPFRVEFELVLPLDPPPGLIGVRVLSTCFVIRNFAGPDAGGQVNAWVGELDDFRDHLFDPALGETRPRKPGGGIRPFATERGSRYRFVIHGRGGADAEWTLEVEGEVAHRFRPGVEPRASGLEVRVEMPCEIEEFAIHGHVAGLK